MKKRVGTQTNSGMATWEYPLREFVFTWRWGRQAADLDSLVSSPYTCISTVVFPVCDGSPGSSACASSLQASFTFPNEHKGKLIIDFSTRRIKVWRTKIKKERLEKLRVLQKKKKKKKNGKTVLLGQDRRKINIYSFLLRRRRREGQFGEKRGWELRSSLL
jgi:hypothetical protein